MWLLEKFNKYENKIAIFYNNNVFTYKHLLKRIKYYISFLQENKIEKGKVVFLVSNYSFNSISILLALAIRKNIIAISVDNNFTRIENMLNTSNADFVLTASNDEFNIKQLYNNKKHPLIEDLLAIEDSGLILFSSGTSGTPKTVLHNFTNMIELYKNSKVKNLNTLLLMGFDHIGGLDAILRVFSIAATMTLIDNRADPECVFTAIEKYKVSVLPATPSLLNLLFLTDSHKKYDLTSLNIIAYGAESIHDLLLVKIKKINPKVIIQQKFGTTETGAIKVFNNNSDERYFDIVDNKVEYRILNNELWIKSKNNMIGYLSSEMNFVDTNNWINTGDIVEKRKDGSMKIIGRTNELINVGGKKVLPLEVENCLLRHPEVEECKVYGIPNLLVGNIVGCDIVLKNKSYCTSIDLRKFCSAYLENFKLPVKINFIPIRTFNESNNKLNRLFSNI